MQAIILAGGYAKRLWPLTQETPKPLLNVGGKEIITRILEKVEDIPEIDHIAISTNAKFEGKFKDYCAHLKCKKKVTLVIEPTLSEDKKLGSIGGLNYLIDHLKLDKDTLIIGGDNLFEFDLKKFIAYHKKLNASIIALKKIDDTELIKQYGICVLDDAHKIIEFQEKPENPKSQFASTACYMFKHKDLMLIKKYLSGGNSPDAMGLFIAWLIRKASMYGYVFSEEWYDIGSFESLADAQKRYSS